MESFKLPLFLHNQDTVEVSHFYSLMCFIFFVFIITDYRPAPAAGASSLRDVSQPTHSAEGMLSSSQSSEGGASVSVPPQSGHSGGE